MRQARGGGSRARRRHRTEEFGLTQRRAPLRVRLDVELALVVFAECGRDLLRRHRFCLVVGDQERGLLSHLDLEPQLHQLVRVLRHVARVDLEQVLVEASGGLVADRGALLGDGTSSERLERNFQRANCCSTPCRVPSVVKKLDLREFSG